MPCLAETNPELVAAARDALQSIEPAGSELARETTFSFQEKMWWTKIAMDPHANTIERWDVLPLDDPRSW